MKVLQTRNFSGWANFGQNDQYYMKAHSIQIDEQGLVWRVENSSGEKQAVMSGKFSDKNWEPVQMEEKEARESFIEGTFNSHEELLAALWS